MANENRITADELADSMDRLMERSKKFTPHDIVRDINLNIGKITSVPTMRSRLARTARKIDPTTEKPAITKHDEDELHYTATKRQAERIRSQADFLLKGAAKTTKKTTSTHTENCAVNKNCAIFHCWGDRLTGKP